MAQRLFLSGNPPRLITSKPGYNADTALADTQKTFDSNWFNGGGIKFQLTVDSMTQTSADFPYALSYVPSVVFLRVIEMSKQQMSGFWSGTGGAFGDGPPSTARGVFLVGGYGVGTASIFGVPVDNGASSNYITRALVFEG